MLGLKVPKRNAEKIRVLMLEKGYYDKDHKLKKEADSLVFPLIKRPPKDLILAGTSIIETEFEPVTHDQGYPASVKEKIPEEFHDLIPSSYDHVGTIAIIDIKEEIVPYEKDIAKALLESNRSIETVLKKSGIHVGEFRTQDLIWLAGKKTKETIYKENNVSLMLDVEKVYFSPRLATERKRIYQLVRPGEDILVMFSGCGPYPCTISKNTDASHITAIEKNPVGHKYAEKNIRLNSLDNITAMLGDVRDVVPNLGRKFDRILMPLPKGAEDFLGLALSLSRKGTIIHFYDFEHESEFDKGREKVERACKRANISFNIIDIIRCGQYSPGKFRICVDFRVQ